MGIFSYILDNGIVSTSLAMLGRLFVTVSVTSGAQMSYEMIPTVLRGQGNALANFCAQISLFFTPMIVYSVSSVKMCKRQNNNYSTVLH